LQALDVLDLVTKDEDESVRGVQWRYRLAAGIDPEAISTLSHLTRFVGDMGERGGKRDKTHPTNKSGNRAKGEPDEAEVTRLAMRDGA
jgi:hypothetical protein